MYIISVLSISCVILSATSAPRTPRWSSEEENKEPYWFQSRRSAYPPVSVYSGSFGDELTSMLEELERSLQSAARQTPQFPPPGQGPVFSISTSSSSDSDSDEDGGPVVSVAGSSVFSSLFNNFGGFDTKNLKNKTTVKTEVIDGHKVTVKESTYVSDQDGVKSVIQLSEVDLADSDEPSDDKPKTSTPKASEDESPEDKGVKENEPTDTEHEDKDVGDKKSDETPKEDSTPEVEITKPTTDETSRNDEDNETALKNSEENSVRTNRHPDSEVEIIDTDNDNNYFNYRFNDRVVKPKEVGSKKSA